MKHFPILLFLSLFSWQMVQAQSVTFQPKQLNNEGKGFVYEKETAFNFRLHTNGWAMGLNFGTIKTYYKTRYYSIEFGELKHIKEQRHTFDYPRQFTGRTSRSFLFGKQNNFYALRAGIGVKRYFSEKAKRKGVAVGISYEAGPSLGILKPYYLDFLRSQPNDPSIVVVASEKYNGNNYDSFTDVSLIYGASGFSKGLGEVRVIPGLHGKISVHFDWGAFDEFVKAFEAGIMLDVYAKKVPIMVDGINGSQNRPFFINLYLTLQLGKRW